MKHCAKCNVTKVASEFSKNGTRLRSQCKSCVAERSRLWRIENPDYAKAYMREYQEKNYTQMMERIKLKKLEIHDWKRARGCTVCLESEPWVLDMHHLDPSGKEANSATSATLRHFLREASKCILLCSNCHRKVHAGVLILSPSAIQAFKDSLSLPDSLISTQPVEKISMRAGHKEGAHKDGDKARHYKQKLREVQA